MIDAQLCFLKKSVRDNGRSYVVQSGSRRYIRNNRFLRRISSFNPSDEILVKPMSQSEAIEPRRSSRLKKKTVQFSFKCQPQCPL